MNKEILLESAMRIIAVLFFSLIFIFSGYSKEKWKEEVRMPPPVVCYASDESNKMYIEPPYDLMNQLKSTGSEQAEIIVTYDGFSDEPKAAFQFAVDIISGLVYSPVPIRILARWTSMDEKVLGSAGPNGYYKNFESAILKDRYYPVALAEKLEGKEINGSYRYDVVASFNKDNSDWYFGTDGNTPSTKYDFASIVLHEIIHGLGFTGFMESNNGVGSCHIESVFGDGIPGIFDEFVINQQGQQLIDTSLFANPSILLHTNLTSNSLVFNSFLSGATKPVLYAPADWDDGSSIYHLNENTYHTGDNALMTPFSSKAEAIYNPGPLAMNIMYDMGWKSIRIEHEELKDIELLVGPIAVGAYVESDFDLDVSSVYVFYSEDNFETIDSVLLQSTDTINYFASSFSPSIAIDDISYYITASDIMGRRFKLPTQAPDDLFNFQIGEDTENPVAIHVPYKYILSVSESAKIRVEATDNVGIKLVSLQYLVNNGRYNTISMQKDSANWYSADMDFEQNQIEDGDIVKYRIVVTDASLQSNKTQLPTQGLYSVSVEGINDPVEAYTNSFNTSMEDFIGSDFEVMQPSQFDNSGLNTQHPYPSTEDENETFDFITILRYPIIIKENSLISYDEVVLVEPGDVGNNFGDEDFWDYVIVEGSKDNGITWLPLVDGYDSKSNTSWYVLYVTTVDGNDTSTATGNKDLLINREFGLITTGNFQVGDIILIRFRLFSDPLANGWGWFIDNLKIQETSTNASQLTVSPGKLFLFPNPVTDKLTVNLQTEKQIQELNIKAFNILGEMVLYESILVHSNSYSENLNIQGLKPGIYLFSVQVDEDLPLTRKIIVE